MERKAALLELEAVPLTGRVVRLDRRPCPRPAVVVPLASDAIPLPCAWRFLTNRTRSGDRARPSDRRTFETGDRYVGSGGDARLPFIAPLVLATPTGCSLTGASRSVTMSRRAAHRATRIAKRRQRSETGYACTDDCSARTADHDVRIADRDVRIDHFSLGNSNDSHSFTRCATASGRWTVAITGNSIAFCSRSIAIGHRDGRARGPPFLTRRRTEQLAREECSCDYDEMLSGQRCSAPNGLSRRTRRRSRASSQRDSALESSRSLFRKVRRP